MLTRTTVIFLLLVSLLPGQSFWSSNARTHPELSWQVISTEHFNIYYHQGLEDIALSGAAIAEQVYQSIMDQLEMADFGKTDIVFTAEDEIANGFAMPTNQIFIWVSQNDVVGWFTGSEKWLRAVIAHEFQHIVFFNGVRTWWGTWNLLMIPDWFIEGVAEYYTEKWRVGRSDSRLKVHTYNDEMERLDPHDAGYAKVLYLADKYGDSTITKLVHYRHELRIGEFKLLTLPYSFNEAFEKTTGQTIAQFNEEWRRAMNTYYYSYRGQKEGVEEVGEPVLIPKLNTIRGLSISPDSSQIAVIGRAEGGMGDWSLYTVSTDSSHTLAELHYGLFSGNPAWSPDGKTIAVSEYHRGSHGSLVWDIRLVDVEQRKARWLTDDARAVDPTWSPDGRYLLYAAHPNLTTNLYIAEPSGGNFTRLTSFAGDIQIQDPHWSPDGGEIVFAIQGEDGSVDVAVVGSDGSGFRKLTNDPAEDLSPLWSADGQWIVFTSFRNSTPNLYRLPVTGGDLTAMTDVAEGIYTTQIMPGSGEVVSTTLGDVDTVRVRRLPIERAVEPNQIVIRDIYSRWRDGQPEIRVSAFDPAGVPAVDGPRPYRSWGTWRPLIRFVLPDVSSVGGFGLWQDALGKNQLILAGSAYYYEGWDWDGIVYLTNARFLPFINLAAYRNTKLSVRGYGDGFLVEEISGMEAGALFPFNLGNHLSSEHSVSISLGGFGRRPIEEITVDTTGTLGSPAEVDEGRISFQYQWKSQRPHRAAVYLPSSGSGIQLRYDYYTDAIFGDFNHDRASMDVFIHQKIPKTPFVLFVRGIGTSMTGSPPPQDRLGLLSDQPFYLNPASIPGLVGEFIWMPRFHSLRGLDGAVLGERVVSGTLELRLPLVEPPLINILGIGLGQFTAAVFMDFGWVWDRGSDTAAGRSTQGVEVKGNIIIGGLPLLTLSWGLAGEEQAWEREAPHSYLRLGLVSPF